MKGGRRLSGSRARSVGFGPTFARSPSFEKAVGGRSLAHNAAVPVPPQGGIVFVPRGGLHAKPTARLVEHAAREPTELVILPGPNVTCQVVFMWTRMVTRSIGLGASKK